ncbi:MAG TPA: class I SAM-dependent methyltransferase [Candidatus Elarobacter sp.]|jgi:SAM-dependent methyltransferase
MHDPTPEMIYRVSGQRDRNVFDDSAVPSVESILEALVRLGRGLDDVRSVYDFACGCGRIARPLLARLRNASYAGSDIDETAIGFLAAALPTGRFFVNGVLPPLPLEDETFDLVFGWSIFTHFDESYQDAWLAELRRITRPGGSVLLTVSGEAMWEWLAQNSKHRRREELLGLRTRWREDGFVFWDNDGWEQHFPSHYHTAFHTPEYIRRHWSRWFEVVDVVPGGARPAQDMVILRRPASP